MVSEALDDREKIWGYYVQVAGSHTAEKVLREIGEIIALIEDHPLAGRARSEVHPGLRSFAATPHVVFYRVVNDTPQIVRMLDDLFRAGGRLEFGGGEFGAELRRGVVRACDRTGQD